MSLSRWVTSFKTLNSIAEELCRMQGMKIRSSLMDDLIGLKGKNFDGFQFVKAM